MKKQPIAWAIAIAMAAGLTTTAFALDLGPTRTAGAMLVSPAGAPVLQLNFAAELRGIVPDVSQSGVVLGWATVGGINPQPFRILIPALCFSGKRSLTADDFRACGAQIAFGSADGRLLLLSVLDFEVRLVPQSDKTHRFDLSARVTHPELLPAVLGALGGSAVQMAMGRETSIARPTRAETVSGIEPTPF